MAAGSTYTPIATTTLGSATNSVTFSSISGSYTDLVLVANLSATTTANIYFRVNGDTGNSYSFTMLSGDGAAANGYHGANTSSGTATWTGASMQNTWTTCTAHFMKYSNTNTYKYFITNYAAYSSSGGSTEASMAVNLYRSTSAIDSITVLSLSPNYVAGSTLTLYGITAA